MLKPWRSSIGPKSAVGFAGIVSKADVVEDAVDEGGGGDDDDDDEKDGAFPHATSGTSVRIR